jgi:hypothetical protein
MVDIARKILYGKNDLGVWILLRQHKVTHDMPSADSRRGVGSKENSLRFI